MKKEVMIVIGVFIILNLYVIGAVPSFSISGIVSNLSEDQTTLFAYNFTNNVTNGTPNEVWTFSIDSMNSSLYSNTSSAFYSWFSLNSSTGLLNINASKNNQTGNYTASIKVIDQTGAGMISNFYFIINATNDAPLFTNISSNYNLTQATNFLQYINGTDEDLQYPLYFNVSFVNCTHASWSSRNNCSLLNASFVSNTSSLMNFTPTSNDVGVYTANISVMDSGSLYSNCTSGFCASNYSTNRTTYYSSLVTFNVFSLFTINSSQCNNSVFQENGESLCNITVYSRGIGDILNLSSRGYIRNSPAAYVLNNSWFLGNGSVTSTNFSKIIEINITPGKSQIGNWSINVSILDTNFSVIETSLINIFVNRTSNANPLIETVSTTNTSINVASSINFTLYDNDLLIPERNESLGGYNETLNLTAQVLNRSNLAQQLSLTNFTPIINTTIINGTNISYAYLYYTPNSSEAGNYTINLTLRDKQGSWNSSLFNLTIANNTAPKWNAGIQTDLVYYEGNVTYLNISQNVSDLEGDTINFSYTNDTSFTSFEINSTTGIINFTSNDKDVGQHLITIIATDRWRLTNSTTYNITIYNVNDNPYILNPILQSSVTNATVSNGNITCLEGNLTTINFWMEDDDFKIPAVQKSAFYTEALTLNYTMQGANTSLFTIVSDSSFPTALNNRSRFYATFTPRKEDVGDYNITINATDNSGKNYSIRFNITVLDNPDNPILSLISNISIPVNTTFSYRINASDDEDGSSNVDGNNNFTFSYVFLEGNDFINNNQSKFNRTTGLFNITFNDSLAGTYRINITVNDSSGLNDSQDFYIRVYDTPRINFPTTAYTYNLTENQTSNFTFQVNHSALNNLSYFVYGYNWNNSQTLIYSNENYYGNNTNLTFSYTPDFNNETNGVKNITLVVYSFDSNFSERVVYNTTASWNLTVTHSNSPLAQIQNIGGIGSSISGVTPYTLNLVDYFRDYDFSSVLHNQTIAFSYTPITTGCGIGVSVSNWINGSTSSAVFSTSSAASCNFTLTALELNESNLNQVLNTVVSNEFLVDLGVNTATVSTPSSGGGGGSVRALSFRVITPDPVSAYAFQTFTFPIVIENTGQTAISSIVIDETGFKDGQVTDLMEIMLDKKSIPILSPGEKVNLSLGVIMNTNQTGNYEILLNATSSKANNFGKVFINFGKANDSEVKKYLLFAEEFLSQNSRCMELKEYIKSAYDNFNQGDYGNARIRAEEAVNSCKNILAEKISLPKRIFSEGNLFNYLLISIAGSFIIGIGYYMIKRWRLKNSNSIRLYEGE